MALEVARFKARGNVSATSCPRVVPAPQSRMDTGAPRRFAISRWRPHDEAVDATQAKVEHAGDRVWLESPATSRIRNPVTHDKVSRDPGAGCAAYTGTKEIVGRATLRRPRARSSAARSRIRQRPVCPVTREHAYD